MRRNTETLWLVLWLALAAATSCFPMYGCGDDSDRITRPPLSQAPPDTCDHDDHDD